MNALRGSTLGRRLSPREAQIQLLLVGGASQAEIARELGVDRRTVVTMKARIAEKQGLASRALPKRKPKVFTYRVVLRTWQRRYMRDLLRAARYNMRRASQLSGINRTHLYRFRARVRA